MNNYKINCVGMSDEQKRLVHDAFFKLGYSYYGVGKSYYDGDYYFAYADSTMYRMRGEDTRYFEQKNHTEITLNELLKLANMEEYMTFTKADLKDGQFVRLKGTPNKVYIKIGGYLIDSTGYMNLYGYSDTLEKYDDDWSVVEVMSLDGDNSILGSGMRNMDNFTYKTLWKRPEQTAQQKALAELEAKQQELINQAKSIAEDIAKLKGQ